MNKWHLQGTIILDDDKYPVAEIFKERNDWDYNARLIENAPTMLLAFTNIQEFCEKLHKAIKTGNWEEESVYALLGMVHGAADHFVETMR